MSCDPNWLDEAIRIMEKQIQEMNRRQRYKEQAETPLGTAAQDEQLVAQSQVLQKQVAAGSQSGKSET
jgi:hypothetical protein